MGRIKSQLGDNGQSGSGIVLPLCAFRLFSSGESVRQSSLDRPVKGSSA